MLTRKKFLFAISALLFIISSCTVSKPELLAFRTKLMLYATDNSAVAEEKLSFYASVADRDGINDIAYLYVINDEHELCWALSNHNWNKIEEGDSVWIGLNALEAPGIIPRGTYRVVIVDKAGERNDNKFILSAPGTSINQLPILELENSSLKLNSPYAFNTVFFLDSGFNVTMTANIKTGLTALDTLWPNGQWRTNADYAVVYSHDTNTPLGFFSCKIRLPD